MAANLLKQQQEIFIQAKDIQNFEQKHDESFDKQFSSLLKSYTEAVAKISCLEISLSRAKAEIDQLKSDISQSIKREEETQEKIAQVKQELREYKKMCKKNFEMLVLSVTEEQPKWLSDEEAKINSETKKRATGCDQLPILPPAVEEVAPTGSEEEDQQSRQLQEHTIRDMQRPKDVDRPRENSSDDRKVNEATPSDDLNVVVDEETLSGGLAARKRCRPVVAPEKMSPPKKNRPLPRSPAGADGEN